MSSKSRIAVILPTRGMPFSQTIDEIIRECRSVEDKYDWDIYWSHARKVPDCLNVPTNQALRRKSNKLFWFVDDDMIFPEGILERLIDADKHAIVCDYPASITMGSVVYDADGRAYFGGNGCLLVKREVLEDIKKPIWRSDVGWAIKYHNDHIEFEAGAQNPDRVYGQHDVHFGLRLYAQGKPLYVLEDRCGQRKLRQYGDTTTNDGAHKIDQWVKFHPNMMYIINEQEKRDKSTMGDMILARFSDGGLYYTSRESAARLMDKGLVVGVAHAVFKNYDIIEDKIIKEK